MKRKARHFKGKPVNKELDRMCRSVDTLAQMEALQDYIDPEILKDLANGATADELRKKYHAKITARQITIALKGKDDKAINAIKDLTDRTEGRATEKKEFVHRLEKLDDNQLNAMLLTELEDLQKKR